MLEAKPEGFGHLLMGGAGGKKVSVWVPAVLQGMKRGIQEGQNQARKGFQSHFPDSPSLQLPSSSSKQ